MIVADLERFASTGMLGPFDSTSTRSQIEQLLGVADPDSYQDFATYGDVAFDVVGGIIQIVFPHSSHMAPPNPNWTDWTPPTCFNEWPDKRFQWNLGRFIPGLTIDAAIESLDDFDELERTSSTDSLRILHNTKSGVSLCFERDAETGDETLARMVAFPRRAGNRE